MSKIPYLLLCLLIARPCFAKEKKFVTFSEAAAIETKSMQKELKLNKLQLDQIDSLNKALSTQDSITVEGIKNIRKKFQNKANLKNTEYEMQLRSILSDQEWELYLKLLNEVKTPQYRPNTTQRMNHLSNYNNQGYRRNGGF